MSYRTILGHNKRLRPTQPFESPSGSPCPQISIDSQNIDRGIVLHDLFDFSCVSPRNHGHHRMVRILLLNQLGQLLKLPPNTNRILRSHITFHLISQTPDQYGRMIFIFSDCADNFFPLFRDKLRITILKSVPLMLDPYSHTYSQAELIRLINK